MGVTDLGPGHLRKSTHQAIHTIRNQATRLQFPLLSDDQPVPRGIYRQDIQGTRRADPQSPPLTDRIAGNAPVASDDLSGLVNDFSRFDPDTPVVEKFGASTPRERQGPP